jgi:DNA-binding response OmpR family regulator
VNVLVVEDERALRNTLGAALTMSGHSVVGAETGIAALAEVARQRPDLIVLDLQLPEMDGWEFLSHFRARPEWATVPVVVTSATYRAVAAELDAEAFFAKPFDLDAFLETVEQLLAERKLAQSKA